MLPRVLSRGAETPTDVSTRADRLDHGRRRRASPPRRPPRRRPTATAAGGRRSSASSPGCRAPGRQVPPERGPHPSQLPHPAWPSAARPWPSTRSDFILKPGTAYASVCGDGRGLRRRLVGVLLHDQQRQELVPAGQLPGRLVEGRQLVVLRRQGPLLPRLQRHLPDVVHLLLPDRHLRQPAHLLQPVPLRPVPPGDRLRRARSCAAWSAARRRGSSTRPAPPPAPPTTRPPRTPHRASPTTTRPTSSSARPSATTPTVASRSSWSAPTRRCSRAGSSSPNGGWSGWAGRSVSATGTPAVARNLDGRMEAFVVGADGLLRNSWQLAPERSVVRRSPRSAPRRSRRSPAARRPPTPTAGSRSSPSPPTAR